MLENLRQRVKNFVDKVSSNGQFSRDKGKYVFDRNRGAYPGSFVPVESIKGPLEPKDLVLTYTVFPISTYEKGFRLELEQFGKPVTEPIIDTMYFDGRSNEDYYNVIDEMRRIAGDHVID